MLKKLISENEGQLLGRSLMEAMITSNNSTIYNNLSILESEIYLLIKEGLLQISDSTIDCDSIYLMLLDYYNQDNMGMNEEEFFSFVIYFMATKGGTNKNQDDIKRFYESLSTDTRNKILNGNNLTSYLIKMESNSNTNFNMATCRTFLPYGCLEDNIYTNLVYSQLRKDSILSSEYYIKFSKSGLSYDEINAILSNSSERESLKQMYDINDEDINLMLTLLKEQESKGSFISKRTIFSLTGEEIDKLISDPETIEYLQNTYGIQDEDLKYIFSYVKDENIKGEIEKLQQQLNQQTEDAYNYRIQLDTLPYYDICGNSDFLMYSQVKFPKDMDAETYFYKFYGKEHLSYEEKTFFNPYLFEIAATEVNKEEDLYLGNFYYVGSGYGTKMYDYLRFLPKDAKQVYNYYYNKGEYDKAYEFLNSSYIKDGINQKLGQELAMTQIQNLGSTGNLGDFLYTSAVELIFGSANAFVGIAKIFDHDGVKDSEYYRKQIVMKSLLAVVGLDIENLKMTTAKSLSKNSKYGYSQSVYLESYLNDNVSVSKIEEALENGEITVDEYNEIMMYKSLAMLKASNTNAGFNNFLTKEGNLMYSIGNQLPSMLLSIATTPFIGQAFMALGNYGNKMQEYAIKGEDGWKAMLASGTSTSLEFGIGLFLSGIPGMSLVEKSFIGGMLSEGTEEVIQTYADAIINSYLFNDPIVLDDLNAEALEAGIYGAFSAGLLKGGVATVQLGGQVVNLTLNNLPQKGIFDSLMDILGIYTALAETESPLNSNIDVSNLNGITDLVTVLSSLNEQQFDLLRKSKIKFSPKFENFMKNYVSIYTDGTVMAQTLYNTFFQNFREHGIKHALYVANYANKISESLSGIDKAEILYAGLAHDFGMKGGVIYIDSKTHSVLAEVGLDKSYKVGDVISASILEEHRSAFKSSIAIDNMIRSNHPLNSAIYVLNTNDLLPSDVNKNVVALLAMSHSKSTSGTKHISSKSEWLAAVDKLESTIYQYNELNNLIGTEQEVIFDSEHLRNLINDPNEFIRLQDEALIIRDADAMAPTVITDDGRLIMQDGKSVKVFNRKIRESYDEPVSNEKKGEKEEASYIDDFVYSIDGKPIIDIINGVEVQRQVDSDKSKSIHAGESNVIFDSHYTIGATRVYTATIKIVEDNQFPLSTWEEGIKERLNEILTYTNADSRTVTIVLSKNALKSNGELTELAKFYERQLDEYKRSAFVENDKNGVIDLETLNKQIEFLNKTNIQIVYE